MKKFRRKKIARRIRRMRRRRHGVKRSKYIRLGRGGFMI